MRKVIFLTVLLALVVFAIPANADPEPKDVNVVNEPTVHVETMPDVNCDGDVNVTNTPLDVNVTNEPVQVEVVNEGDFSRQPFQNQVNIPLGDGVKTGSASFTVPLGSTLVIETISGQALLPLTQDVEFASIGTRVSGASATYELILLDERRDTGGVNMQRTRFGTERVRIYADPGTNVSVSFQREPTAGDAFFSMSVSGYLVPVGSSSLAP